MQIVSKLALKETQREALDALLSEITRLALGTFFLWLLLVTLQALIDRLCVLGRRQECSTIAKLDYALLHLPLDLLS